MQMEAFLWLFLPVFVAGGSALLSYFIMQARMDVALAKERETLAEARAMLSSHKITLEERVKATEEACKRQALDDFMHDIRVDERSYVKETKSLNSSRKTMVMQERIFFRNIPLSNWIEREMVLEEGQNLNQLPMAPIFTPAAALPVSTAQALPPTSTTSWPSSMLPSSMLPSSMSPSLPGSVPSSVPTSLPVPFQQPDPSLAIARLLNEVKQAQDDRPEEPLDLLPRDEEPAAIVRLTQHATAFGAQ